MKKYLVATGDPIYDIGVLQMINFFKDLKETREDDDDLNFTISQKNNQYEIEYDFDNDDKKFISEELIKHFKDKLNSLILPSVEMKLLRMSNWEFEGKDGYRNPLFSVELQKEQLEELKIRHNLKNAKKKPTVTFHRNYYGLKNDWISLTKKLNETVIYGIDAFFSSHEKKGKTCPLCGEDMGQHSFPITQNKHLFYGRHHNVKIRGYFGSKDGTISMCAACNLILMFSSTTIEIPYLIPKKSKTHLFLPQCKTLGQLESIFGNLTDHDNYIDLIHSDIKSYRTNIKQIQGTMGVYSSLLAIYFMLRYRWVEKENWEEDESFSVDQLTKWIIPTYEKGQNVVCGSFYNVQAYPRMLEVVKRWTINDYDRDLFNDVISRLRFFPAHEKMSKGIMTANIHEVAMAIQELSKERIDEKNQKNVSIALFHFSNLYGLLLTEVDHVLEVQELDVVKKVAQKLGRTMGSDIGLSTKIFNSRSSDDFMKTISEAFVKYYKYYILNKDDQFTTYDLFKNDQVDTFIELLQHHSFQKIRDIFIIYFTITAVNQKVHTIENKNQEEMNQ